MSVYKMVWKILLSFGEKQQDDSTLCTLYEKENTVST